MISGFLTSLVISLSACVHQADSGAMATISSQYSSDMSIMNQDYTCLTGTYVLKTESVEMVVDILLQDDKLMYKEYRGERIFETELQPSAGTENGFYFKENDAVIQFVEVADCKAARFDISINGSTFQCLRQE